MSKDFLIFILYIFFSLSVIAVDTFILQDEREEKKGYQDISKKKKKKKSRLLIKIKYLL